MERRASPSIWNSSNGFTKTFSGFQNASTNVVTLSNNYMITEATPAPGGLTCTTAFLTCVVSGLTNGTSYTFSVTATNTAGTSASSSASTAVIPLLTVVISLAPTAVTAVAANGLANVSWVASVGAASYTVTSSPGGLTCTTAALTCSVAGLSNGTSYTFSVTATNIVGTSVASVASAAVTPLQADQVTQVAAEARVEANAVAQAEVIVEKLDNSRVVIDAVASVDAKAQPIAGHFGELAVTLSTPAGGSVKLELESAVSGKTSAVKCGGQSCVIAATKANTTQSFFSITTLGGGQTAKTLVAAIFASRYPNNVFALNSSFRKEIGAFVKTIKGKGGVITIIGSHSQSSHDAYGVKMANLRAQGIVKEFKALGAKARINFIKVNAKTVKGGLAGATATWHS